MNPNSADPFGEELARLLADYDEALAQGRESPSLPDAACPEVLDRLRRGQDALRWLNNMRRQSESLPSLLLEGAAPPLPVTFNPETGVGRLGRFRIVRELGRGAHGIVYLAFGPLLCREIALKIPRPEVVFDSQLRHRFLREARAAADLEHPNLVTVYDAGEVGPFCYIASAYCRGPSLATWLRQRTEPVDVRDAAALVAALADAVHYIHGRGILHRDIKPENVLLDRKQEPTSASVPEGQAEDPGPARLKDWTPKLADFGLAKLVGTETLHTPTRAVLGTPPYMAPEQAEGRLGQIGPATDVYALGIVLYEMLTGQTPFRGATAHDTLRQVLSDDPAPLRQLRPDIPKDLETVCLKCLHKEADKRYTSARELADDLHRWQTGQPVKARPVGILEKCIKWLRRHPAAAIAYGLLALVVVLGGLGGSAGWLWLISEQAREQLAQEKQQSEIAHQVAETVRARLAEVSYLHRIGLAYREWQNAEIAHAEALLADPPVDKPDWEWRYVKRLCHADLRTLTVHTRGLTNVAFSPDGRRLATPDRDGTIYIWDSDMGQPILICRGHQGIVNRAVFSPDGRHLLSCCFDQTVRLWDTATGTEILSLPQGSIVVGVAFSPNGRFFATACREQTIQLWDARTRQVIRTFHGLAGQVGGVVFSPNSLLLAAWSKFERKGEVKLWEVATGKEVLSLRHADVLLDVVFSPDGQQLAAATLDRSVRVWNSQTGQAVRSFFGHTDQVYGVAYNREGTRLATAGRDRTARIWDAVTGEELTVYRGHKGTVGAVAFSPSGRQLASASADGTVKLWDATLDPRFAVLSGHVRSVSQLKVSPDGTTIASAGSDGTLRFWDIFSRRQVRVLPVPSNFAECVAYSADGKRVAYGGENGRIQVWDMKSGSESWALVGHTASVQCVAFNPDGTLLASASGRFENQNLIPGEVKLWDAHNGREIHTLKGNTKGFNCLAFSPDGKRLVSGGGRDLAVWDLSTGQQQFSIVAHDDSVVEVAFSPDGKRIASASFDNTVKVWDAATGEEILTYRGIKQRVTSVVFHQDGRRFACGGDDGTVRIVVVPSGDEALTLRAGTGPVHSVAFSPDGNLLVSGGWDDQIRIWDGRPPDKPHPQDSTSSGDAP